MATVLIELNAEACQLVDIADLIGEISSDIDERDDSIGHRYPDLDQATAAVTQVRGVAAQLTAWADKVAAELGQPATGPDLVASFRRHATAASRDLAESLWGVLSRVDFGPAYRPQVLDIISRIVDARMEAAIDDVAGVGDPDSLAGADITFLNHVVSRIQAVEP